MPLVCCRRGIARREKAIGRNGMGGHYGSVQVRSEDRERVRAVAEQVARERGIHILVAPPVSGWIALFPENPGQEDAVGRALAEQLDADVLHLLAI
jgi:hypothetical protein